MSQVVRLVLCASLVLLGRAGVGEAPTADVQTGRGDASLAAAALVDTDAPSVQVEYELVRIPIVSTPARSTASTAIRHARLLPLRAEPEKFTSRARRVLLGDGTHRPQPFPRPTRN